jgi:hypothetical protein
MAIRSRAVKPVTITNTSGQPEIVLEINGMTISMTPPAADGSQADGSQATAAPVDDSEEGGQA